MLTQRAFSVMGREPWWVAARSAPVRFVTNPDARRGHLFLQRHFRRISTMRSTSGKILAARSVTRSGPQCREAGRYHRRSHRCISHQQGGKAARRVITTCARSAEMTFRIARNVMRDGHLGFSFVNVNRGFFRTADACFSAEFRQASRFLLPVA